MARADLRAGYRQRLSLDCHICGRLRSASDIMVRSFARVRSSRRVPVAAPQADAPRKSSTRPSSNNAKISEGLFGRDLLSSIWSPVSLTFRSASPMGVRWCPNSWCRSGTPWRVGPPYQAAMRGRLPLRPWPIGAMVSKVI